MILNNLSSLNDAGGFKSLSGLNSRQKEAVLYTKGPLLIIAGAGAGKTKTITERVLHLIAGGVSPSEILAITFTNKAMNEMKERIYRGIKNYQETRNIPFVSTFHSLGVLIIKENSEALGLPRRFTIFDKNDSNSAVREAMKEVGIDPKCFNPLKILNIISQEKGKTNTVENYYKKVGNEYFPKIVATVWSSYEKVLKKNNALDFDDLLLKSFLLLNSRAEIRESYEKRWKYIHIDEYQDTNNVQYEISRLLAGENKNICVVGDIDQNIYSWRGAKIQNIINFEKDYLGAKVILLEENYRSTKTIISAANSVIIKNKFRHDKNLFTKNEDGEKISLFTAYDETDEANFVAKTVAELIEKNNISSNKIVVLYRANFQSRALEEAFLQRKIPYQLLGTRFFERKEVKDVISFIRAARNPECSNDIARVINIPARGIGKVTLKKVLENKEDNLSASMKIKINDFKKLLKKISDVSLEMKPSELIRYVIKETGIEAALKKEKEGGEERLENIRELVTLAIKYNHFDPEEGIEKFLEEVALASDQDSLMENKNGVKLMTVHASKGLEFEYVFIVGLEEDLFPHKKWGENKINNEDGEEERRLFYVALTRAEKKIFLTYTFFRTIFGIKKNNIPSQFISDISDDLIEEIDSADILDTVDIDGDTGKPARKTS